MEKIKPIWYHHGHPERLQKGGFSGFGQNSDMLEIPKGPFCCVLLSCLLLLPRLTVTFQAGGGDIFRLKNNLEGEPANDSKFAILDKTKTVIC